MIDKLKMSTKMNVYDDFGLNLIMNHNKRSKNKESSENNSSTALEQELNNTFQILKYDIMTSDMVCANMTKFLIYLRKVVAVAIHNFEKDNMRKLD